MTSSTLLAFVLNIVIPAVTLAKRQPLTNTAGSIISPGYPNTAAPGLSETWTIQVEGATYIFLHLRVLLPSVPCTATVDVADQDENLLNQDNRCGQGTVAMTAVGSTVFVHFSTENIHTTINGGFQLNYTAQIPETTVAAVTEAVTIAGMEPDDIITDSLSERTAADMAVDITTTPNSATTPTVCEDGNVAASGLRGNTYNDLCPGSSSLSLQPVFGITILFPLLEWLVM